MNLEMLYKINGGQKVCRICEQDQNGPGHLDECPGNILDNLTYEIKVSGANCTRGCCGYTYELIRGNNLNELVINAVAVASEAVHPNYELRMTHEMPVESISYLIEKTKKDIAKTKAAFEADQKKQAYQKAMTQLEVEKPDLSVEGYNRRKAEIDRKFGRV